MEAVIHSAVFHLIQLSYKKLTKVSASDFHLVDTDRCQHLAEKFVPISTLSSRKVVPCTMASENTLT